MTSPAPPKPSPALSPAAPSRALTGIVLAALGYIFFAGQDAIVKWLVATLPVWQILFFRSVVIMLLAAVMTRGEGIRLSLASRRKMELAGRAVLILVAWTTYYSAARVLGLAELVTLYFAAPIFVLLLSMPILGEKVTLARWIAVLAGFAGVMLASDPGGDVKLVPAAMVLFAAFCWALTSILVRLISSTEATTTQMVASNFLFAAACAPVLPFVWVTPGPLEWALLLGLGVVGGLGQFLVFEGFRLTPASAIAPFEYTALIWAFVFGYLIFGETPKPVVFAGAGLIMLSGAGLLIAETRRRG